MGMNLYEKLALARQEFKTKGIKASGKNDFAKYSYFDLSDILPATTELEVKHKMISIVSFDKEYAKLTLINAEEPSEKIEFTSPMSTATLKGCHEVQNLGAVETYVRRYLYLIAYEIVETEALDKTQGKEESTGQKAKAELKQVVQPYESGKMTLEQAKNLEVTTKSGEKKKLNDFNTDDLIKLVNIDNPKIREASGKILDARALVSNLTEDDLPFGDKVND